MDLPEELKMPCLHSLPTSERFVHAVYPKIWGKKTKQGVVCVVPPQVISFGVWVWIWGGGGGLGAFFKLHKHYR